MSANVRTFLLFLTGSVFFLALPFIFSPELMWSFALFSRPGLLRDLTGYVLMLGIFYLNYFIFLPGLYFQKKYFLFAAILLCCFIIVMVVPKLLIPWHDHVAGAGGPGRHFGPNGLHHHGGPPGHGGPHGFRGVPSTLMQIGHNLFIFLLVIFVSLTLQIQDRLKQAQKEKLGAELSFLKAQINPHFLFNSLNSIYSLAIERSEKTADAVVRLSGMMRYVISEASRDFVSLEKELEYIQAYIQLQKIRLGNTISIDYEISGDMQNNIIAPLILIPFVENAFKYGVNSEEDSAISIKISTFENNLTLDIKNHKVKTNQEDTSKTGVGIENSKSRLQHIYPGKHQLTIQDTATDFIVSLRLELL